MACGLKKQNTNEGGVHLTERTCSPYNPIIKLIVDDCLGLPIYPVTSIDAVIDEDGNTLRKLLEDLLDQIHTGGSITELIEHILLIIEDLDETYVTKTELTQKLELLYKISSMNRTNVDGVLNYDTTETTKPYIVKIIEDILSDLAGIINGGDGITLLSLLEQITALNDLLIAVANYDTSLHTDAGLTHSLNNTIPQIEIIYRIQDLITRLEAVERAIGTGSSLDTRLEEIERALAGLLDGASTVLGITDALDGRVDTLEDKVEGLEASSATHAHLDDVLLGQRVAKLEANEYPVTSAIFMGTREAFIEFANKLEDNNIRRIFVYYPYHSLIGIPTTEIEQQFDYNNNGLLDVGDVDILVRHILNGNVITDSHKNPNVNGDETVNIADVNALVDKIFDSIDSAEKSPGTWSKCIFEVRKPQNNNFSSPESGSVYEGELTTLLPGYTIIKHPLIEGKLYVDSYSLKTFVYKEKTAYGVMSAVSGLDLLPGNGIIIDDEEDTETDGILLKTKTISAKIPTIAEEGSGIKVEHDETTNTYTVNRYPSSHICIMGRDAKNMNEGDLCIGYGTERIYRYKVEELGGRPLFMDPDINIVTEAISFILGNLITTYNSDNINTQLIFNALIEDLNGMIDYYKADTDIYTGDNANIIDEIKDFIDSVSLKEDPENPGNLISKTLEESVITMSELPHAYLNPTFFGLSSTVELNVPARSMFYPARSQKDPNENSYTVTANGLPIVVADSFTLKQYYKGIFDFNNDNSADINDVTLLINKILGLDVDIDPVGTVRVGYAIEIRNDETFNNNHQDPILQDSYFVQVQNSDIAGELFYNKTDNDWWTSDGTHLKAGLPEYRLVPGSYTNWMYLSKDGVIILAVKPTTPSTTSNEGE